MPELERIKRLRVLAGPNGSGKSTVITHIIEHYYSGKFLNADVLNKSLKEDQRIDLAEKFNLNLTEADYHNYIRIKGESWIQKAAKEGKPVFLSFADNHLIVPEGPGDYDAAIAADFLRYKLLQKNETFTFETVLSDERKIEFLQEAAAEGFKLYLYFVCTQDPEINKKRVENRVKKGGHFVPPDRIESRYYSSLNVLAKLIPYTYRCFLFDNSEEGDEQKTAINLVAEIEKGDKLTIHSENVPAWVQENVIEPLFAPKSEN